MTKEVKDVLLAFALAVAILALAVLVVRLGFQIIGTISHGVIGTAAMVLGWLLTFAVSLLTLAVSVLLPIALAIYGARALAYAMRGTVDEFQRLKTHLKGEATASAKDATFLAIVALMAGMAFFMETGDFLEEFSATKLLVAAAAMSCLGKMMILLPSRSAKMVGVLATFVIAIGFCLFIEYRYQLFTGEGFSADEIEKAWRRNAAKNSEVLEACGLAATLGLFLVSVGYPFTPKEWRRIWSS